MPVIISNNIALTSPIYDTYNKAVIGWRNLVARGNVSALDSDPLYPVSNLANTSTAAEWRPLTDGVQELTISASGAFVDYVGIAKHNLAGSTVSVLIDGNVVFTETMIANNEPLILRFDKTSGVSVVVRITPPSGTIVRIGVMYVGELTVMMPCILQDVITPDNAVSVEVVTGDAESGDFLGRIVLSRTSQTTIPFSTYDKSWFDAEIRPFSKAAEVIPFFFAWLPDEKPEEVSFSWLLSTIQPSTVRYDTLKYNFEMNIGSLVT